MLVGLWVPMVLCDDRFKVEASARAQATTNEAGVAGGCKDS